MKIAVSVYNNKSNKLSPIKAQWVRRRRKIQEWRLPSQETQINQMRLS